MDDEPSSAPQQMGAFLIEKELWNGTNSKVFRAQDTRDNATVALKVLFPTRACSLEFQKGVAAREASRLKLLSHSHIIPLRKHGEIEGVPYLSFPYIEGQGLDLVVKENPQMTPTFLTALLREMVWVCDAMEHAHSNGIIHRDLKPQNIIVSALNQLCVLDWGLAWKKGEKADRAVQQIVGTPAYMSPEQARGEENGLTPASDVYSLGAILYFLLTGKPPFEASSSWKTMQMAMCMEPLPPSQLKEGIDSPIEQVVLCALAKTPEKRYASAGAMGEDLVRALNHKNPRGTSGLWARIFGA